jgi:bidirectional [NiFe] hydrogenase diaphorase subunit
VDACTDCGKCVMACPTGALFHKGDGAEEKHEEAWRLAVILRAHRAGTAP